MNNLTADLQMDRKLTRLWIALVLGTLSAIGPLSIDMYLPSLPTLTDDLHTSTSLAQLSLTACLLGIALGQLFTGSLSDTFGRRIPLITSLIAYGIASFLCAVAPSIWTLVLLRFIQGTAGSAGIVISRAMVRDIYSGSEMTKFFSLLMLVNGLAPILAPVMGGQLLKITSWRGIFIVLGILSVAMLLSVVFSLPETLSSKLRSRGGLQETLTAYRDLIKNRVFMGYALAQGLVLAAMFAYISGSPFVLQNIFGLSPQAFSISFAVNGLGIILASQVCGRLAGRIKEKNLFIIGLGIAGLGGVVLLITILVGASLPWLLISLFLVVSSVGIVTTMGFSLAMQGQSRFLGSASALLGLLPFILGAAMAPLVGIAGSQTALPMGIVIASCELGAILCYLALTGSKQTR